MKLLSTLFLLLMACGLAGATPAKPRPEIMGISLDMKRDAARARLQSLGTLEKEDRKRQEVWAIKDPRVSYLLVGYDGEYRVRYVTAIARSGGPRIRYQEVADLKAARQSHNQNNHKFTWEIDQRRGHTGYILLARGHDPQYLDSYSVKKLDNEEEID